MEKLAVHIAWSAGNNSCCCCLLRMRARAKMIVKEGLCTTYYRVWQARALCMSVHPAYYLMATRRMGGEMIVVVKCRGEESGNMLLRQTRRSTHNNCRALVNVHDDTHHCCLGKSKTRLTLDCPMECCVLKLKKVGVWLLWQTRMFKVFLGLLVCL